MRRLALIVADVDNIGEVGKAIIRDIVLELVVVVMGAIVKDLKEDLFGVMIIYKASINCFNSIGRDVNRGKSKKNRIKLYVSMRLIV